MPDLIRMTPAGRGAVATLRVEGAGVLDVVGPYFVARGGVSLDRAAVNRLLVGKFGGEQGEEIVLRRCSGEVVELHCHGGLAAIARIEATLVAAGCRVLSQREWLHRQDDQDAAEALAALADAPTERMAAILLDQYHGAFQRECREIESLIGQGDFHEAQLRVDALRSRAPLGRHLVEPWRVVLAGRVNVGKSSLMNAIAGYGRSIVHATPGTTRDAVTLTTAIDGLPVELCDTAGMRDVSGSHGADLVERAGMELAAERLSGADLAVLVFDVSRPWSSEDQALVARWPDALLVHNKWDLRVSEDDRPAGIATDALHGVGVEELLCAIGMRLVRNMPSPGVGVPHTNRQREIIDRMGESTPACS